ncbi:MAG TPA: hypothetical protein VND93_02480 [Myxococcales bacterium]|nr:hypothetical protein [Myxococcales bacterium]
MAEVATPAHGTSLPSVREMDGERAIALVLRGGALLAGLCFALSITLELLSTAAHDAELLRAAGATLLVVTPVARLVVAGVALGRRGEYRYSTYAAIILALLIAAAGLGFTR